MFQVLKNNKGATLVGQIMAAGVIVTAAVLIFGGVSSFSKAKSIYNKKNGLESVRNQVIQTLESEIGMANTIAANPSLSCLATRSDCAAQASTDWPIKIVSSDGVLLVDPGVPTQGFSSSGVPCTSFDAINGNDSCPIQLKVSWQPICGAGPCLNPQNRFIGAFSIEGKAFNQKVNVKKYGFTIFPLKYDSTLESNCAALGGTFNSTNGNCALPMSGLCPVGQVVLGVASNNQKNCGYMHSTMLCPSGTAIDSVDVAGNVTCKPISFCPPFTVFRTWDPWVPDPGSDAGGGGGDGCDGADGCDGGS